MQISLGNHYLYAPRIDVGAVSEKFKNAVAQDKQAVIRDAMKWWEPIVDCFYGHKQEKALALVFEIAQAEKANEDPTLSHAEKAENRCRAEEAFLSLKKYALPQYKFDVVPNFNGKLRFKVTDADIGNASEKSITSDFNCFDTENAEQLWKEMRSSFMVENGPAAIGLLNQLCNATSSCEKIDCFTQLTKLAEADAQNKFKLIMQAGPGIATATYISLSFGDTVKFENLICPHDQMDGIWSAVLAFAGSRELKKAELASPETEQLFSLVVGLRNDMFNADDKTRSAAAKILAEMFRPNKTVQDDMRSCVKLSKLDPRFRNLFKVSFAENNDGKLVICLNLQGIPYKSRTLSDEQAKILKDEAATKFQSLVRRHLTVGRNDGGKIRVLKESTAKNAKSLAYKMRDEPKQYPWVAVPPEISPTSKVSKGSSKYVSHIGPEFIALSYRKPYQNSDGRTVDPIKMAKKGFNTLDDEILEFIKKNKLDYIVPQVRINQTQFLSRNVGSQDLFHQVVSRQYEFSYTHFQRVASNLDTLHAAKIIHRDIKPSNMALHQGNVHLLDLDTMGHSEKPIGNIARLQDGFNVTTTAYLHPALRHGFYNSRDGLSLGIMVDQYSFISSMISVFYNGRFSETGVFHTVEIDEFLLQLPCSAALKREVKNFLLDPIKNPLPKDRRLSEFLSA